ncbi:MAG: hypothetical protein DRJ49_07395 [Thermoprotei archaeon]|nr:MAG: hypothetical protein DRJ49_07395 [Thermoprotei archaeon]
MLGWRWMRKKRRETERLGEIMMDIFAGKLIEKEDAKLTEEGERELVERVIEKIIEEDLI